MASVVLAIIRNPGLETIEVDVVADALQCFGAINVGFADARLTARAAQRGQPVASFDRDLDKFKDVRRFEPKP